MKKLEEEEEKLRTQREESWPRRWADVSEADFTGIRESEEDMMRFFRARKLTQLDKRCWLLREEDTELPRQYEMAQLRRGEVIKVTRRRRDRGGTF